MKKIFATISVVLVVFAMSDCKKSQNDTGNISTVSSAAASQITDTSAVCGGNVVEDGGAAVNYKGVVWSTTPNPELNNSCSTMDGSGTGSFVSTLSGLVPNTTYYYKAYAMNTNGVAYGDEQKFTTQDRCLTEEYFQIQGATYVKDSLPASTSSEDISVKMNERIIAGGTNTVSVEAQSSAQKILVGIQNEKGYYEVTPSVSDTRSGNFVYRVVLIINQGILTSEFVVRIAIIDLNGRVTRYQRVPLKVIPVGTGGLQVSLSFDNEKDVDLHLKEPDGSHIYFGNRQSSNGGWLDLDSNPGCSIDGVNNENIFYSDTSAYIQPGTYTVYVLMFSNCVNTIPTQYSLAVYYKGQRISFVEQGLENPVSGVFPIGYPSEGSSLDNKQPVCHFVIPDDGQQRTKTFSAEPLTESAMKKLAASKGIELE